MSGGSIGWEDTKEIIIPRKCLVTLPVKRRAFFRPLSSLRFVSSFTRRRRRRLVARSVSHPPRSSRDFLPSTFPSPPAQYHCL